MRATLIFPPQWSPLSPHCAMQTLCGELNKNDIETFFVDLNIGFYEYVLKAENLSKQLSKIGDIKKTVLNTIKAEYQPNKSSSEYSQEFVIATKHLLEIQKMEKRDRNELINIIDFLPHALNIIKSKEHFYNLSLLQKAWYVIDTCLNICSLPYYPFEFTLDNYTSPFFKFTFENILEQTHKENIFSEYYYSQLSNFINSDVDAFIISVGSVSQLIGGLTFAKILKMNSDIPVILGGNYVSRVVDAIEKTPSFFDEYCDYVVVEEGEKSLVELVNYLADKENKNISDVSRLIYKDTLGNIVRTKMAPTTSLNEIATQDFKGLISSQYYLPEMVIPIQASRGCYWKKCTFCDHDFGQGYNVKNPQKLVQEIKELQQKYGVSKFEFVDEAISANYLKNFSQYVLDEGLEINWYCNCRLEDSLTDEILQLARKAGLRMILWGFESGSKRIMELINKGVDIDKRTEILDRAHRADIWNFAYIFFGFPTETKEDAQETIDIIKNNPHLFNAFGQSVFTLGKYALIRENPEKYGIKKLSVEDEPFSSNCTFELLEGMTREETANLMATFAKDAPAYYENPTWMQIKYREALFLYICKYSKDGVINLEY